MTSVFNIHPNDLSKKLFYIKPITDINLTFLDDIKEKYDINIDIYYNIIKFNEEFKLNVGAFIHAEISSPAYISNTVICKLSSQPLIS